MSRPAARCRKFRLPRVAGRDRPPALLLLVVLLLLLTVAAGCGEDDAVGTSGGAGDDGAPGTAADDDTAGNVGDSGEAPSEADETEESRDDTDEGEQEGTSRMTTSAFGTTPDGEEVTLFECSNGNGLVLRLIDWGATVVGMEVPDRDGRMTDVTLSYDDPETWFRNPSYFGCTVGRYCNRIAGGKFTIDGTEYTLATNNGPNHLHGGEVGFGRRFWTASPIEGADYVGVRFHYESADGEEGYPGTVKVVAEYVLNNNDELVMRFTAETDQATAVNLTNHCYWNLAGGGSVLDHDLMLAADRYLPVDDTLIPTGELAAVAGTPMDFTEPQTIGSRLEEVGGDPTGYDHCYVVASGGGEEPVLAARVFDPQSGREMEIWTTQPGIQFYTGNFLDGSADSGGADQYGAFCLETQHYPDSPNQEGFPSTVLQPGEMLDQTTIHRFRVRE